MTEAQAEEAERSWNTYHDRQKALSVLESFGMREEDLLGARQRSEASDTEAVVAILKRVAANAENLHERKMAFYYLATYAERDGLPFVEYLTEASRCDLLTYKQTGRVKKVEILTAGPGNACPECEAQRGKVFTIEEALSTMPLPCSACSRKLLGTQVGFCRCTWLPVLD